MSKPVPRKAPSMEAKSMDQETITQLCSMIYDVPELFQKAEYSNT